jgi:hypothetical protein
VIEVEACFGVFFDHSKVLGEETRYFLREFETKRGNDDLEATASLLKQQKRSRQLFDSFTSYGDQLNTINRMCTTLSETLDKVGF